MAVINFPELVNNIEEQVTTYLKTIVELKQDSNLKKNSYEDKYRFFLLELISLLDSFEVKFEHYEEKKNKNSLSTESEKIIDSFKTIYRKINSILDSVGVKEIIFEDNKAQIGLCKIIETKPDLDRDNETILFMLKKGFYWHDKVLRPAEVVTVRN